MDGDIQNAAANRRPRHRFPRSAATDVTFEFDVVEAWGDRGRRLAQLQADTVLDILGWFASRRQPPSVSRPPAE